MKLLGVLMIGSGFFGWVTFFFAGSGHAFLISLALVAGGTAILYFNK